jgi:large subunit ribosomal protein L13
MKRKNQPSFYPKPSNITKKWWVVDAKNKVLGRLATEVAILLTGKHKASYTPGVDMGDFVVVINADQIAVTGNKETDKKYYRHSGYPGGLKTESYADVKRRFPERIIERAVKGMLPKTRIKFLNQLKVYAGSEHPHEAQQPEPVNV